MTTTYKARQWPLRLAVLLLFGVAACSTKPSPFAATSSASRQEANAAYHVLVAQVQQDPAQENLSELRDIYLKTDRYTPNAEVESAKTDELFEAMGNQAWTDCIAVASAMLDQNYTSLYGHFGSMACQRHEGNTELASFHETVLNDLLEVLWATGDGASPESAFHTISTPELQAFVQLQGLETITQALKEEHGHWFEVVTVRNPKTDKEFKLYFDIGGQWSFLATGDSD